MQVSKVLGIGRFTSNMEMAQHVSDVDQVNSELLLVSLLSISEAVTCEHLQLLTPFSAHNKLQTSNLQTS